MLNKVSECSPMSIINEDSESSIIVQVLDCAGETGVGAITFFDWENLPASGLTMEVLEKWWCIGDHRNRGAVWTQGVKRS